MNTLTTRERIALANVSKFNTMAAADRCRWDHQKYHTNVLLGDDGLLWVPFTHREESILIRMGYEKAL